MLKGKSLVISGVVTTDSIAFAVAQRALELGAEVVLTAPARDRDRAEAVAEDLAAPLVPLDVNDQAEWAALEADLRDRWPAVDGALHAVAYAPQDALDGRFVDARPEGLTTSFQTSAVSYGHLAALLERLAPPTGASLVGLDFDAAGAWPTYNWMGVMKAALEAANRYVARDLGRRGIRSNLIAAGPIQTRAAGGDPRLLPAPRGVGAPGSDGVGRPGRRPGGRRRLLPVLGPVPGRHGGDPPRRRRLPRHGHSPPG